MPTVDDDLDKTAQRRAQALQDSFRQSWQEAAENVVPEVFMQTFDENFRPITGDPTQRLQTTATEEHLRREQEVGRQARIERLERALAKSESSAEEPSKQGRKLKTWYDLHPYPGVEGGEHPGIGPDGAYTGMGVQAIRIYAPDLRRIAELPADVVILGSLPAPVRGGSYQPEWVHEHSDPDSVYIKVQHRYCQRVSPGQVICYDTLDGFLRSYASLKADEDRRMAEVRAANGGHDLPAGDFDTASMRYGYHERASSTGGPLSGDLDAPHVPDFGRDEA